MGRIFSCEPTRITSQDGLVGYLYPARLPNAFLEAMPEVMIFGGKESTPMMAKKDYRRFVAMLRELPDPCPKELLIHAMVRVFEEDNSAFSQQKFRAALEKEA